MSNIYIDNGFKDRNDYLGELSRNYGLHPDIVYNLADMLGPSEDFDGLLEALDNR